MKVYLDDRRPAPDGWLRTFTVAETINTLKYYPVSELSLDHDLGRFGIKDGKEEKGIHVLDWIYEQVVLFGYIPPKIYIHSDNASGVQYMKLLLDRIEERRFKIN